MKKNKITLISAIVFSIYVIYIVARTIYFALNSNKYGDVYFEFMFYPHLVFIILATTLNYILFFKNNKYIKYSMIFCYLMAIVFIFINK